MQYQIVFFTETIDVGNSVEVVFCTLRLNLNSPYCLSYSYLNVSYENLVVHQDITVLMVFFILNTCLHVNALIL